jgi:hypothetical protein
LSTVNPEGEGESADHEHVQRRDHREVWPVDTRAHPGHLALRAPRKRGGDECDHERHAADDEGVGQPADDIKQDEADDDEGRPDTTRAVRLDRSIAMT